MYILCWQAITNRFKLGLFPLGRQTKQGCLQSAFLLALATDPLGLCNEQVYFHPGDQNWGPTNKIDTLCRQRTFVSVKPHQCLSWWAGLFNLVVSLASWILTVNCSNMRKAIQTINKRREMQLPCPDVSSICAPTELPSHLLCFGLPLLCPKSFLFPYSQCTRLRHSTISSDFLLSLWLLTISGGETERSVSLVLLHHLPSAVRIQWHHGSYSGIKTWRWIKTYCAHTPSFPNPTIPSAPGKQLRRETTNPPPSHLSSPRLCQITASTLTHSLSVTNAAGKNQQRCKEGERKRESFLQVFKTRKTHHDSLVLT